MYLSTRIITDEQMSALNEAIYFIEGYVEYFEGAEPLDDGPTDAEILSNILPVLKSVFSNPEPAPIVEERVVEVPSISEKELKNKIDSEKRKAAESVNPNYRYCVVDSGLYECGLTDQETDAMEYAIKKSKGRGLVYVCEIRKVKDGTYKTFIIGVADNGDYSEKPHNFHSDYLHFNYIAEACGELKKI